jgi:carbon-monoxide dehydrogenase medium subunit
VKPAPFDYYAPTSLEEAVATLAEVGDDAKLLAGGQSLIPILALRLSRFDALVDLGRVDTLSGITRDNGSLRVGAMTTQAEVGRSALVAESVPLLARATPLIGHFQIRNRGTVGGSIAHADPAAEYPAVALALDAEIEVAGPSGPRVLAAADLFVSTFVTALGPGDVLSAVRFPVWGPTAGFAVEEVARRHGDFAIAGAACGVEVSGGAVVRAAVALFGVGSTPVRSAASEAALVGASVGDVDHDEVGRLAASELDPPSDVHGSAAYRRHVAGVCVARGVRRAVEEAVGDR